MASFSIEFSFGDFAGLSTRKSSFYGHNHSLLAVPIIADTLPSSLIHPFARHGLDPLPCGDALWCELCISDGWSIFHVKFGNGDAPGSVPA